MKHPHINLDWNKWIDEDDEGAEGAAPEGFDPDGMQGFGGGDPNAGGMGGGMPGMGGMGGGMPGMGGMGGMPGMEGMGGMPGMEGMGGMDMQAMMA
jgi:hypothetical protein